MGTQKFSFENGGPKRIEVHTGFLNSSGRLVIDGVEMGRFGSKKELQAGKNFKLPDASFLEVKLVKDGKDKGLQLRREGVLLPGSAGSAQKLIDQGASTAFFVMGLSVIVSLIAMNGATFLSNIGYGLFSLIVGLLFGVLGFLMKSKQSFGAAVTAAGLYGLEVVAGIFIALNVGANPMSGIFIRAVILYSLVRAAIAAGQIRDERLARAGAEAGALAAVQTEQLRADQFPPAPPAPPAPSGPQFGAPTAHYAPASAQPMPAAFAPAPHPIPRGPIDMPPPPAPTQQMPPSSPTPW